MSGTLLTYGAFSDYLEAQLLQHAFGSASYAKPTGLWIALYTTPSTEAAPGSELTSAGGYARVPVTFGAAPDQSDGSSAMWNTTVLQFPVATADWGVVTHCGIHDAVTGGHMLASGQLVTAKTVAFGDAVRFAANQFMVGLN